jgi:AcrR family transcriptional regulator
VATLAAHLENGQRNRERILDAASTLMSERGFAGATIAAICKQAEVMPPTLYWHFGDKEGLVAAVMERAAERWFEEFIPGEDIREAAQTGALSVLFHERPEFLRLLLLLALERRDPADEVRSAVERIRQRAKQAWSAALEQLLIEIESPEERNGAAGLLSELLIAQVDGVFIASQLHPQTTHVEALIELMGVAIRAAARQLVDQAHATQRGSPPPGRKRHGVPRRRS